MIYKFDVILMFGGRVKGKLRNINYSIEVVINLKIIGNSFVEEFECYSLLPLKHEYRE